MVRTAPTVPWRLSGKPFLEKVSAKETNKRNEPYLDISFKKPKSDGGSPVLSYRLWMGKTNEISWWNPGEHINPSKSCWIDMGQISAYDADGQCDTFRCRIAPIEKGARYSVKIFSVNAVGWSEASEESVCVFS